MNKGARIALVLGFLAVIFGVGLTQAVLELRQGQRLGIAELATQIPTEAVLRAFENDLKKNSWFEQSVRPWMQYLNYMVLRDAGQDALVGRDDWLFYRPGVHYLTQAVPENDAVAAIVAFRDRLRERGIELLVLPVPGKASVYPERLTSRAIELDQPVNIHTRDVIAALRDTGVEVIDLTEVFSKERSYLPGDYYLAQDTHWAPQGMRVAAAAVANRILALGWVEQGTMEYVLKPASLYRLGDLLEMMQAPPVERYSKPEEVVCSQVVESQSGRLYQNDDTSEVLILGDSFLRIYETNGPGSGGFIAHLARELQRPLASIVNDGGASTLVRQQLSRNPGLLKNTQVVIWEFVERDIRFGVEGWQNVALP